MLRVLDWLRGAEVGDVLGAGFLEMTSFLPNSRLYCLIGSLFFSETLSGRDSTGTQPGIGAILKSAKFLWWIVFAEAVRLGCEGSSVSGFKCLALHRPR